MHIGGMEYNMMKILLYFHGGSDNHGCEAIVQTATDVIRNTYPDAYIALASTKPESDKKITGLDEVFFHNQNRPLKRFSSLYFQNFIETRLGKPNLAAFQNMHQDIIKRIPEFDVFLSIGGDNYCYGTIPDYYELNRHIKKAGKKLLLWGASIGEEDLNPEKIEDLKAYDRLLIRESESVEALHHTGLTNVVLVADGAFLLQKEELPLPEHWVTGNTIGFNYSPLVEKKIPQSRNAVLTLLHHILETTDYTIAMTPHVMQPGNNDYECMQALIHELPTEYKERLLLLPEHLTASQYKGYISRMEFFIGARTHATIAAYSTAVPAMVLGYSIKSKGIAKDLFGEIKLVLDQTQLSDEHLLIENFNEMNATYPEIKKELEAILPKIKAKAQSAAEFF